MARQSQTRCCAPWLAGSGFAGVDRQILARGISRGRRMVKDLFLSKANAAPLVAVCKWWPFARTLNLVWVVVGQ
jgi:hypothetical protein